MSGARTRQKMREPPRRTVDWDGFNRLQINLGKIYFLKKWDLCFLVASSSRPRCNWAAVNLSPLCPPHNLLLTWSFSQSAFWRGCSAGLLQEVAAVSCLSHLRQHHCGRQSWNKMFISQRKEAKILFELSRQVAFDQIWRNNCFSALNKSEKQIYLNLFMWCSALRCSLFHIPPYSPFILYL